MIKVDSIDTVSKTTKCPGHLTGTDLAEMAREPHKFLEDESLKALGDKLHIGTSATRGPIIKQLVDKDKYLHIVARKGAKQGYLEPTDDGYRIYQNLKTKRCVRRTQLHNGSFPLIKSETESLTAENLSMTWKSILQGWLKNQTHRNGTVCKGKCQQI